MKVKRTGLNLIGRALFMALPCGMLAAPAFAQDFPTRPIQILNGSAPGGFFESVVRLASNEVQQVLGQPITIESRPGAGGKLGLMALAKSRGDAHMLGTANSANIVTVPLVDQSFKFEPGRDYSPLILMYYGPYVLTVNKSVPASDLK